MGHVTATRRVLTVALLLALMLAPAVAAESLADLKKRFRTELAKTYAERMETVKAIAALGTADAARFLVKVIEEDEDRSLRLNTIHQVARIKRPEIHAALLRWYRDDPDLRSTAFHALTYTREEPLPKRLLEEVLAGGDQSERSNLLRYFAKRKDPRLTGEAKRFLDEFPNGATSLVSPLTSSMSPAGARILVKIYDDNRKYDRTQVPKAFAAADPEVKAVLPEAIVRKEEHLIRNAARIAMRGAIEEAEPAVVDAQTRARPALRAILVECLGALGPKTDEGREAILFALKSPEEVVVTAAVKALRTARLLDAIPVLVALLRREEGILRAEIAVTLTRITGQQFGDRIDLWEAWWENYGSTFDPDEVKEPDPDTLDQALVDLAIEKGAGALRAARGEEPPWDYSSHSTGTTALVLLALHAAGADAKDRDIKAGLKYLAEQPVPQQTYDTAIVAMALAEIHPKRYRRKIADCAKRLLGTQNGEGFWGYPSGDGDHSNTQYAVLGLRAAAKAGIRIPDKAWRAVRDHLINIQGEDGGWAYRPENRNSSSASMTAAGVSCLLVCLENMKLEEEGKARLMEVIDRGFTALGEKMKLDTDSLYALYGIERAGILGGRTLMAGNPWYVPGARRLIEEQDADGNWRGSYTEAVETSFAILFLKKATAPISSR